MWIRILVSLFLLASHAAALDVTTQADAFVQAFVTQKRFQGSVLVAREGKPLFRKSYGLANVEWDAANTPDTKFRLGSISKQFTAVLILQLAEQGKLKLEDSVRKYYPDGPASWDAVTIHHLLSHQSGIPSYTELPGFFRKLAGTARTPAEIVQLTQDKPLEFDPGTKYKYDNTGYVLLGYVIEKVSGRSYEEQLQKAILEPVGMKDTGFDHYETILRHRAEGYQYAKGELARAQFLDMSLPHAAGSLYSTVDDLVKWDDALYGTKVLSEASKDKAWKENRNRYGYGWVMGTRHGKSTIEHGGGINGFNTMLIRVPSEKLVAVALSNVNTQAVGAIADGLLGMALGKTVEPPRQRVRIGLLPEQMKPFEGVYVGQGTLKMTVTLEGDHLRVQATGQGPAQALPMSPTRFFNDQANAELEFEKDGSGFTLYQGGAARKFRRE
ncbi:MAG: serine hydrolase [Acidobacteria bacterium]|nr:serine hydrolase [Acidobacteriota bacterium]